ncbi:MAG: apolipoprotein N-acyltransferase, partial [Bdellovibrionales bacterium]|nr:apolipoprotein N-acyltransferase [Bdellovibrionales bacterium]
YYFISFLGVLLSLIIWGHQLPKRWKNADAIIRPLIIQANIPNQQKVYAEKGIGFRSVILNKFLQMTHEAHTSMSRPDFAIWPETAFPEYLNLPFGEHTEKLNAYIRQQTLPLITGGYSKHPNRQTSNSLFFINEEGEFSDMPYHKSILLAFGEYIPGAEKFPQLKKWLPMVADFKRGEGPQVRNFLNIKVGPQICYESLYPEFSWGLVNSGAEVIVNVTNDSWFGWWQEPYQHMIMTLARGIEFRRPVIRSTNTGISTVMLATGEQLKQSPIGQEWAHTFIVPYKTKPELTFYAKTFNLIPNLIIMAIFFILLFFRIKKYKDQKQSFKRFM